MIDWCLVTPSSGKRTKILALAECDWPHRRTWPGVFGRAGTCHWNRDLVARTQASTQC